MGFWNWLLGYEQKTVTLPETATAATYIYGGSGAKWTAWDYNASAMQAYMRLPHIYRAIKLIAEAVGALPWQVVAPDGTALDPTAHPLAALLQRPNRGQSQADLLKSWVSAYYVGGNGYLRVLREGVAATGAPLELVTLRPDRVQVLAPDGKLAGYAYKVRPDQSVAELLPPENVEHLYDYHPTDDWYGLSPVQVAARTIDQLAAGQDWNTALLQQSARPPGALVSAEPLSPNAFDQLDKQIVDMMSGPRNAGKPLLLEGGLDWKPFGLAPAEMDWLSGKEALQRDIAIALGVPSQMLGDTNSSTFANYEQARESFYVETVFPLGDRIADRLTAWLTPLFAVSGKGATDLRVVYDRAQVALHSETPQAVWARALDAKARGVLTANEARALMGYPPIDGGDTLAAQQIPMLPMSGDLPDARKARELGAPDIERAVALWAEHAPPRYKALLR